jgi:nondiscriminating aspartyl-tRNA synthetase
MAETTGKQVYGTVKALAALPPGERDCLTIHGMIHSVRDMGGFAFLILRCSDGLTQCVYDKTGTDEEKRFLKEECAVEVSGKLVESPKAINGFELLTASVRLLSAPKEESAVALGKKKLNIALEKEIGLRPLTLRASYNRAVFKIQEGFVRGFRRYLEEEGFTEIFTPKLVAAGAEGGANIFSLDYFGRKAYLAQSPQF